MPRELTLRALLTGMLLGALLTPCNVYSGLKIGWSFNMSIIALLIGFALWRLVGRLFGSSEWGILESNINQTTASSAATIISGGLVAPIPAYTMLTGQQIDWMPMMAWVFSVSFLGVWVAWYLRPALIEESPLRFPNGMATLETMRDIFAHGHEARIRMLWLGAAATVSGALKLVSSFVVPLGNWAPGAALKKLTLALEPSLLLVGFGGIIGLRTGLSLALGGILAWAVLGPAIIEAGWVVVSDDDTSLFAPLVEWLIWPGVTLMVTATLTTIAWRIATHFRLPGSIGGIRPHRGAMAGLLAGSLATITLQIWMFDISLPIAMLAIPMAIVLAAVAARVVGETGIPPIGAIGKVSQLSFGVADPGNTVSNLMTANIAGGAAGQAADLLNDFKVGQGIGAAPMRQALAQCGGILVGSVVGVLVYLTLIPDPQSMLITAEWPAPAVATWKAVADVLSNGFSSIPVSARLAMIIAAACGVALGIIECVAPLHWRQRLPAATAVGLAFVIPASTSFMMAIGSILAALFSSAFPRASQRFLLAAAAGLIAGESIIGVVAALSDMLPG